MAVKSNGNHIVNGSITDQQAAPLKGLIVRAFDQDPKTPENFLGESVTDAGGQYKISFTEKDFKLGGVESGGPDVFIRVYDGDALLGESPVTRSAKKQIRIDLAVGFIIEDDPNEP